MASHSRIDSVQAIDAVRQRQCQAARWRPPQSPCMVKLGRRWRRRHSRPRKAYTKRATRRGEDAESTDATRASTAGKPAPATGHVLRARNAGEGRARWRTDSEGRRWRGGDRACCEERRWWLRTSFMHYICWFCHAGGCEPGTLAGGGEMSSIE